MHYSMLMVWTTVLVASSLCRVAPSDRQGYYGRVMMVGDGWLTVRGEFADEMRFPVADDATVTRDGRRVALEEVRRGDLASVWTELRDERVVATTVHAKSPY